MKKTLAAATVAVLIGGVGAANAADFYRGSLKDAPAFVPPPTWSGFYIGGHVGGAWSELQHSRDFYLDTWRVAGASWKSNNHAVFGGGTVGYNYQTGAFVIGVEADFGAMDLSGTSANDAFWIKQDASFYADVTGRLGYALGPALIYAKGGWAYLDNPITVGFSDYFGGNHTFNGDSLYGWTVGGGLEECWNFFNAAGYASD